MKIHNAVALVTGANRGLGRAYAQALLQAGAKVYAAARDPSTIDLPGAQPVRLDITQPGQAAALAADLKDVTLVINNAGIALPGPYLSGQGAADAARAQLETNFFGTLAVSQAFAPVLKANGGGALVNMLSVLSWITLPAIAGYSASKAAAWALTNGLRHELRAQGTLVVGVHAAYIDTDMARHVTGPKTTPAEVARQVLLAIEQGQEEVLADELSRQVKAGLAAGAYLREA
jgi:NAD(P)-dependent dehydrogenase (short-subunit alcohol dehydrogenase family)